MKYLLAIAAAAVLVPSASFAQPNVPVEQLDSTRRGTQMQNPTLLNLSTNLTAPEIYPGENEDVGPQRILKTKAPRRKWFEVVADSQYLYSDNIFLSDDNKVSSTIFVNTIQGAFAPDAFEVGKGQLAVAAGYRSQWFNYGLGHCPPSGNSYDVSTLDFNAQTAFASMRYQLGYWQVFGGFDFTRLFNQEDYDEVYREYVPSIGIQRVFPLGDRFALSAGAQFNYHWTETPTDPTSAPSDVNNRYDASITLAAAWQPVRKLLVQPFYRFQFTQYDGFAEDFSQKPKCRGDIIHTMGLTATYYFTKNISARVFVNYEIKDSDFSRTYDYHKFDAGAGLGLDIRF